MKLARPSRRISPRKERFAGRVVHLVPALFDTDGSPPGGAERYAFELARHMAEVVPTKLVSFGSTAREQTHGALRVQVLGNTRHVFGDRDNPIAVGLIGALRGADVVHCHQRHVVASSAAAVLARLRGQRVVVTEHGGGGWDVSGYVDTRRWYHSHLHVSEFSRSVYGRPDEAHSSVILGGVDTDKFSPPGDERPRTTVVFTGRLLPHKGVDYLIEGLPADIPIRVIGRPVDPTYRELLEQLAFGKAVDFAFSADDAHIAAAYRGALCVVLPSVHQTRSGLSTPVPELLGQTLLEGMASGAPVIATAVGGMREVVREGETGFLVPPNDPAALAERVLWLRDHPAEARRMGAAAREHVVENFTWSRVVDRCLAAYAA